MNTRDIKYGAYAGLAGGLVFGAMMGMMGMLPMIGSMVGQPSALAGFTVHLAISALFGGTFALLQGRCVRSTTSGLGHGLMYGLAWWLLGPLTLMPLLMGMGLGVNWSVSAAVQMLPSLVGHLMYGAVLGLVYLWLRKREWRPEAAKQTAQAH